VSREKGSTRHKLEEASYFFDQMKRSLEDDRVFSFNLSAFITAARSVTCFMDKEFKHATGFDKWRESKQEVIQSDVFKFFKEMRRATVHINRIKPNKRVSISIVEPAIPVTDSVNIKAIRAGKIDEEHSSQDAKNIDTSAQRPEKNESALSKSLNKKSGSGESTREVVRFFVEYPDKNLNELCEKYLQNLTILVDECEQLFNNPE
jgi:hypothetical protein